MNMKIYLVIFILFIKTCVYSQGIVNAYNFTEGTGTTLTDRIDANNGTLAGASLPVWSSNGYISFTGGHGTTGGDWGRINFTRTSFEYAWNSSYTLVIVFRSSKADAVIHSLAKMRDINATSGYLTIGLDASELTTPSINTGSGQTKTSTTGVATGDGIWHVVVITYSTNSMSFYLDGKLFANSTDNNITSGNFFSTNSKIVLGATWANTGSNYQQDLTGDICLFKNFNLSMTVGDVQNEVNEYNMLNY
jgi:hypothetical protein